MCVKGYAMSGFPPQTSSGYRKRIAIIGGGITGLAAAFRVHELDPTVEIKVFESRNRPGGVLGTQITDGFEIEQSADNFITTVPWGLSLCERLGLKEELVTTTPQHRQTFIVWKRKLCKLPDGFMMMAPTRWFPMVVTSLLSPLGKLRAALELFIPRRKSEEDESLEAFAVRRLGREVYERLIEPLVSGIYAADMKKLSLLGTLPRFREMEKKYRSLIWAMQVQKWQMRKHRSESGPRYSMFVTVRGGLQKIITRICEELPAGAVHTSCPVQKISPIYDFCEKTSKKESSEVESAENLACGDNALDLKSEEKGVSRWKVSFVEEGQQRSEIFDGLILATESHSAAKLLESISDSPRDLCELARYLGEIEHTGTAVMTVAYKREQVAHALDGMGAVVPGVEKNPILAISFSNEKYPHRAPEGYTLLRVFAGGARNPEMAEKTDEEITSILLPELQRILGITGTPCMISVSKWPRTMPQIHLGHLERIEKIQEILAHYPTLCIAGNEFSGVGIPQCIHMGEMAAEKLLKN